MFAHTTHAQKPQVAPEHTPTTGTSHAPEACPSCELMQLCAPKTEVTIPRPVLKNPRSAQFWLAQRLEKSREVGGAAARLIGETLMKIGKDEAV